MTTYKVTTALRKGMDKLIESLPLIAVAVGATWWIASSISDVERRLDARIDGLEIRMATIETRMDGIDDKLDLLIQGLNITIATTDGL